MRQHITYLLLLAILATPGRAQEPPIFVEGAYTEAVALLRTQHENVDWAVQRIERLKTILDYARDAATSSDRTAEEKKVYKDDVEYLKEQIVALQIYLKRDSKEYVKSVESYLDELKRTYSEVADWEKARRSLWRRGQPRFRLEVRPSGPVDAGDRVRFELPGLPRGTSVEWKASRGEIALADPDDPMVAIWTAGGDRLSVITAEVKNPRIKMPLVFRHNADGAISGGLDAQLRQDYEDDLAVLINMELGKRQHEAELDRISERIREARKGGGDTVASTIEALQERRNLLKDDIQLQEDWIRYVHMYSLPFMAENDASGTAASWEAQRHEIEKRYAKKGEHWPWHIEPGDEMSSKSWHYVIKDLPEETKVTWRLGRDPESAGDIPGDAEGVFVSPNRRRTEILSAHLALPYSTLPVRIDWILPGSEPSPEVLEGEGSGDE